MPADALSRVFSALADPTRREIVVRLVDGDATVSELAEPFDISMQAVSKHLKVLGDAGLVTRTREAQRRPVHLEADVFDLATKWLERYRREAAERYRRLDEVLTELPDDPAAAPRADGTTDRADRRTAIRTSMIHPSAIASHPRPAVPPSPHASTGEPHDHPHR